MIMISKMCLTSHIKCIKWSINHKNADIYPHLSYNSPDFDSKSLFGKAIRGLRLSKLYVMHFIYQMDNNRKFGI